MPDAPLTPDKRSLDPGQPFTRNPRAPFVELGVASCFSFLHGASDAVDLVTTAWELGYDRIGIADRNSMAGVVRIHTEAKTAKMTPVIGTRLILTCGANLLAYPTDRAAYGRLCQLISKGRMTTQDGARQDKGACDITLDDLAAHQAGSILIALPPEEISAFAADLRRLTRALPSLTHLAAAYHYRGDDQARIEALDRLARTHGLRLVATNDVHYHIPARRPLQDVMTCIREKVRLTEAGYLLHPNAERHLKSPAEMARLFDRWPHAIRESVKIADRATFSLKELKYEYPEDDVPEGRTPDTHLRLLTEQGANRRYPQGIPQKVRDAIETELAFIAERGLARYFITIQEIVSFARSQDILCQGRGSAANSAVCYCLWITSVDPAQHEVLFERFLSADRNEPPDIDVDFEHERREEVIQHIYNRYGRHHAGLCATVIHYRPRMAIREVGKVMGLSEDVTTAMAKTVWGSWGRSVDDMHLTDSGVNLADPHLRRVIALTDQLIGMPRHLGQHVGGFILTEQPLTSTVPIGNGAMPDRSFIEWDKDDIDALGIFKVDVLALGMLTCIRKCFDLLRAHKATDLTLATTPKEDQTTYEMLQRGDSLGVFQVESRAQMAMLPKLRPKEFYDLVIQVAIVRPGPIQGDMVHPYLKRRRAGETGETVQYPKPGPGHDPDELKKILGRTLGVPIFQEQAMKIALVAAKFTGAEANQLRKAMATFRAKGKVSDHKANMVGRMVARGYDPEFAARCFSQIEGFGEYGFPESHAASFAHLVYVSSYLKCHHPDVFACALLNSQPMGFYAPAQIVDMARRSGVPVRAVDVNYSDWDCTLEPDGTGHALRLGFRQLTGLRQDELARLIAARSTPFTGVENVRTRTRLSKRAIEILASADAFRSCGQDRRAALWDAKAIRNAPALPLFTHGEAADVGEEPAHTLPTMPLREQVVADYQTARLSLKAHPVAFMRRAMAKGGYTRAADLRRLRFNQQVSVAGLVLIRQRPGSAKGVCFITLEDESGVVNVVVWPDMFKHHRKAIMGARMMAVHGYVQYDDAVIHVVARDIVDRNDALLRLSEDELAPALARADEVVRPVPDHQGRHPRDVRVIPKSRDFH
ncbi:error-prone DNA polymerase [Jannaschia pagri]|uniref:Error-prone DNA polymerase n=1 Tax=Jannaschia pagri TaxID=2829797 RepID=A0ABQ4NQC2_9RHOB|nr:MULTISPECIES: error-prone DNA polymerase [unclassified Jannaschia]GIT92773.1 error-prone DNA polymerase [Jannaschia sp. AI_61]GIT96608.1 error-prone DNA polymerase [Jannaschia sp. AI_62]